MTVKYFKSRWFNTEAASLAFEKIQKILKNGGRLKKEDTPFGSTEANYADFRGIDLSQQRVKKLNIERADLSHSSFNNSWIENSTFEDVLMEKANFEEISDHGNLFKNVTFNKTKFNKASIGYMGSQYIRCKFENSSFSRTSFVRGEFINSKFIDCKLKGVDFDASLFEDCSFIGKLEDVWFRGGYGYSSDEKEFGKAKKNRMKNVSFEDAMLEGVNFSNECELSTVIPPKLGNYKLFNNWANRLECLKNEIVNWSTNQRVEAEIFINSYLAHAKTQDWFLLNIEEIQRDFGIDIASNIIIVLNELE